MTTPCPTAETELCPSVLSELVTARERRRRLSEDLASGRLPFVETISSLESAFLRDTYVVTVLERRHGLGKVGARRLLVDLGLPERVSLGALAIEHLAALADRLGSVGGGSDPR